MEIKYRITEDILHLYFAGELDHHSAGAVRTSLDNLVNNAEVSAVVFEMKDLNFTDSTGIGLLLGRYKILQQRNIKVYIREPKPQIEKVFKMTGIFQIIPKIS